MPDSDFQLNNPPLLCVGARVQFAPIVKIKKYVEELQEALRLQGFLGFQERKAKDIRIDQKAGVESSVSFAEVRRWSIFDRDRRVALRVDQESLLLLFGDYTNFAEAEATYREVLGAVEQNIQGIKPLQFQLRYINHIPFETDSDPAQWVEPLILGAPNVGALRRVGSVSETSYQTPEDGRLITRCSVLAKGLSLPPDLLPLEIETKHPALSHTPFVLLENLHLEDPQETEFSAESCLAQFKEMRKHIHDAFQALTTQQAHDTWK